MKKMYKNKKTSWSLEMLIILKLLNDVMEENQNQSPVQNMVYKHAEKQQME